MKIVPLLDLPPKSPKWNPMWAFEWGWHFGDIDSYPGIFLMFKGNPLEQRWIFL